MKKLKIVLVMGVVYAGCLRAQFLQQVYGGAEQVSSAQTTAIHTSGFLMADYQSNVSGTKSFFLRKTNSSGGASSANDFFGEYAIYKNSNCAGTPATPNTCFGVSAIETGNSATLLSGSNYAVVGAYTGQTSGAFCVFATISLLGNIVTQNFYDLPAGASSPSQPIVTESAAAPGNYYISGSYFNGQTSTTIMYVIYVTVNGSVIWSKTYNCGTSLIPRGIVVSPFNTAEVVVVGSCFVNPTFNVEGFFMKLNANSGAVLLYNVYGEDIQTPTVNQFRCITPALSSAGGAQGFVIGGHTDVLTSHPGFGNCWLIKLAPNGGVIWNTTLGSMTATEIDAVTERVRYTGNIEYLASATSQNYATVYRVSDNGVLQTGNNLYKYKGININSRPVYLTYLNLSTANDGIQVYSFDGSGGTGDYFVKAYFDGNSGCNQILSTDVQCPGPSQRYMPSIQIGTGLSNYACANFNIIGGPFAFNSTILCSTTSIPGASNMRLIDGVEENSNSSGILSIQPNPTSGKITVNLQPAANGPVKIDLYNGIGQHIAVAYEGNATQIIEFDLGTLNMETGIYFMHTHVNTTISVQKIVYTR